jgi:hypothetical protein
MSQDVFEERQTSTGAASTSSPAATAAYGDTASQEPSEEYTIEDGERHAVGVAQDVVTKTLDDTAGTTLVGRVTRWRRFSGRPTDGRWSIPWGTKADSRRKGCVREQDPVDPPHRVVSGRDSDVEDLTSRRLRRLSVGGRSPMSSAGLVAGTEQPAPNRRC